MRDILAQALLDAPMFTVRWRWVATCALAVPRFRAGAKVPARLQRMAAEDLVSAVFPEQLACAENLGADPPLHRAALAPRDRTRHGDHIPPVSTRLAVRIKGGTAGRRRRRTAIVHQLGGFEAPAAAWERDLLPARIEQYEPALLDRAVRTGRALWLRLSPKRSPAGRATGPLRMTPVTLLPRADVAAWVAAAAQVDHDMSLSSGAALVLDFVRTRGATFFDDIVGGTGLLKTHCEMALGELAAAGLVTADRFAGLRTLLTPARCKDPLSRRRRRPGSSASMEDTGRWDAIRRPTGQVDFDRQPDDDALETVVHALLRRYGVVFRHVLERETALPPWRNLSCPHGLDRTPSAGDAATLSRSRAGAFHEGRHGTLARGWSRRCLMLVDASCRRSHEVLRRCSVLPERAWSGTPGPRPS